MQKSLLTTGLLLLILTPISLHATHLEGGQIYFERVSPTSLSYNIIIMLYNDPESVVEANQGELRLGDGTLINLEDINFEREQISDHRIKTTYTYPHTYNSPGLYQVIFEALNGPDDVLNIKTDNYRLYLEAEILIDPVVGINSSPLATLEPDLSATGKIAFFMDHGFADPDGDSLAYTLTDFFFNKENFDEQFRFPDEPLFYTGRDYESGNEVGDGPPTLTVRTDNGEVVWDAPGFAGKYIISLLIEEYRIIDDEYVKIGHRTLHRIIDVAPDPGNPLAVIDIKPRLSRSDFMNFRLFPNPATEKVVIKSSGQHRYPLYVQIFTTNGQQQCDWTSLPGEDHIIPVDQLAAGVYILKMVQGSNFGIHKLIVE